MQASETGGKLPGGNMSSVVRADDQVHRTWGPWTPTVHRLLDWLGERGIDWTPRPSGSDAEGREVLEYLPGTVPQYPFPAWVWEDSVLQAAAKHLADLHDATVDFVERQGDVWRLSTTRPRR